MNKLTGNSGEKRKTFSKTSYSSTEFDDDDDFDTINNELNRLSRTFMKYY
jgi:hypothetical protein